VLTEAIVSIVIGLTIPKLFVVIFLKKQQRIMMYYLFWGFFSAILVYFIFDFLNGYSIPLIYQEVSLRPIVEEYIKAFPLIALFLLTGKRFEKYILPFAMSSGIGFSILGNYLFAITSTDMQINTIMYAVMRAGGTSLIQGSCTAIIGYGIYLIRDMDKKALPALLLGLYALSVVIHATYNMLILYSDTGKYFGILLSGLLIISLLLLYYQDQLPKVEDLSWKMLIE
jgi:hypothetical protein